MQHNAMKLMSKKMSAAQAFEGEFSEEGLAAMAGDDNLQMAMAKNLSQGIDDADMQRNWTKVKSGPKKPKQVGQSVADLSKAKPSPLDNLPIELQLVADSMIENQAKPISEDTLAVEDFLERLSKTEPTLSFSQPGLPHPAAPDIVLTEDIIARMFANLLSHGMAIG